MFVEGMTSAHGEPVPHPVMQAPVVEYFLRHEPGELRFLNLERMLDLNSVAVTPGVNLRLAPAALKPVSIDQREFFDRHSQRSPERQTVFIFLPSVRRFGFAVKIKFIESQILVDFVIEAKAPALIHRSC